MSVTELVGGAIGCALVGLGGTALVAWSLRGRHTNRSLLYFGLWCCLYGIRLVAEQPFVRATIGGTTDSWRYAIAFFTYAINVPVWLFVEALIGPGWRQSIRRVWQVQLLYAIAAIAADLLLGRPRAAMFLNPSIVLAGLAIGFVNLWYYRHRLGRLFTTPAIVVGASALALFVVNENLDRPLMPGINIEPIGVLLFMIPLGYGVVSSVVRNEAELAAVQRELETARQIQASLLPRALPRTTGLDLAARYIPMTAVAGDLYDIVSLGPSKVGILVADVAGHGVPAALVASMVKLAFSAQADHAGDPARVLTAMNKILCRHVEGTFVTAIYAVVDTEHGAITVASAGHPPLLVRRAGGAVEESDRHGLILGFLPQATYEICEMILRPGDRVLFYTDGVPEAQNPRGEFLDADGLRSWVAASSGTDAADVADAALDHLRRWRGAAAFDDDVTLVIGHFNLTNRDQPDGT